jgi:subfamily B ATP-binding cassette protein MsbA
MSALKVFRKFIAPHRRSFLAAVVLTAAATAVALTPPMLLKQVVDRVIAGGRYELLWPLIAAFACVPLVAAGLRFVNNLLMTYVGGRLVLDMRRRLYGHLQRLPLGYFDRTSTGLIMERLMGDVSQVQKFVTSHTVSLATDVVACAVAMAMMLWLNAYLALVPLLFVPAYVLTHRFFRRRVRAANERLQDKMDQISGTVRERLHSLPVVKSFGQERNETRRLVEEARDAQTHGVQAYTASVAFNTAATFQVRLARVGILLMGYYLVIAGHMSLGAALAFSAYSIYLLRPAVRFAEMSNLIEEVMVSVRRMGEILAEPVEAPDAPGAAPVARLAGEVEFRQVRFEYEPGRPVLQDIDLRVPAGATVALVGRTGCGKTTLVSLLYRFYEPTGGGILLDGRDLSDLPRADLRRNLSLVPQDAVVFEGTVRENIAYGNPGAPLKAVVRAARAAELHEEILRLPDGYAARLGGEHLKLSVGQKQRLMIARAVLADPAILILDEATSALDGQSEQALQKAMARVMAGRTAFVIAHRLSTVVHADLIVVMEGGRIVETGTHQELLARPGGRYRRLYRRQFAKVA